MAELVGSVRAELRGRGLMEGDVNEYLVPADEYVRVLVDPDVNVAELNNKLAVATARKVGTCRLPAPVIAKATRAIQAIRAYVDAEAAPEKRL